LKALIFKYLFSCGLFFCADATEEEKSRFIHPSSVVHPNAILGEVNIQSLFCLCFSVDENLKSLPFIGVCCSSKFNFASFVTFNHFQIGDRGRGNGGL